MGETKLGISGHKFTNSLKTAWKTENNVLAFASCCLHKKEKSEMEFCMELLSNPEDPKAVFEVDSSHAKHSRSKLFMVRTTWSLRS